MGACGRVWGHVAAYGAHGRVWGHVTGGSGPWHGHRHVAGVGTCGRVWRHVVGCGMWQGWWHGVGACGRGWGYVVGGQTYGIDGDMW